MLYLYPSNRTESLAQLMAGLMGAYPLSDPFDQELVLTQSHGMGVWLKQQISEQLGIAAQVQTKMPGAFVWEMIDRLVPQANETGASEYVQLFEKETLRWELFRRLPELLSHDRFRGLKRYVDALTEQHDSQDQRAAIFELSELIADLFDAYQNYRADWIETWESGKSILTMPGNADLVVDEQWQQALWLELYPALSIAKRGHRAAQIQNLMTVLSRTSSDLSGQLPKRIYLFGMGAVPSQWLALFSAVARHTDVHLFLQNPSQYYWGDIVSAELSLGRQARAIQQGKVSTFTDVRDVEGNALLASWGGLGKAFLSELYELDQHEGLQELEHSLYEQSPGNTALHCIQNDILLLQQVEQNIAIDDKSLRFARCHGRTREVEALRDHLLALLDDDPLLSARDIIVMAPDIQAYSGSIESVFGMPVATSSGKETRLPFGISDQSILNDLPVLECVSRILSLDQARISLPEVFELLAVPVIALRFGLESHDVDSLTSLCLRLNIRWGLNESHRDRQLKTRGSGVHNTWLFAFKRCLASYLMGEMDSQQSQALGIEPFALHGRELQEALGKLGRVLAIIEFTCALQTEERSLVHWVAGIHSLFNDWFDMEILDDNVQALIDRTLESFQSQACVSGFGDKLPYSIVSGALKRALENEKVSQRFLAGRVNFCNLMPMRSIPFKVVCLLGMNDGEYPRLDIKQNFDLMAKMPARRGDRSRRGDDRYMFLESLLSAREHLYLSYQGFDSKDNSDRQPSILVSELQDYCRRYLNGEKGESGEELLQAWTACHRLQAFHPNYYIQSATREERRLSTTYDIHWQDLFQQRQVAALRGSEVGAEPASIGSPESIEGAHDLEELTRLFEHPLKYYYQRVLGVSLKGISDALPETEPFCLRNLETYTVARELNEAWLSSGSTVDSYTTLAQRGTLPREPYAQLEFERIEREQAGYRESLSSVGEVKAHTFAQTMLPGSRVTSIVGAFYLGRAGQIEVRQSKRADKAFFGAWFKHVLWNVFRHKTGSGQGVGQSILITPETRVAFPELSLERASVYLSQLLVYFDESLAEPKLLVPSQAYELLLKPSNSRRVLFDKAMEDEEFSALWLRATQLRKREVAALLVPDPYQDTMFRQVAQHMPEHQKSETAEDSVERIVVESLK